MLAIVYGIKKCSMYLKGLPEFSVITDHKPLISILNSKGIEDIENQRLKKFKEKMQSYNFNTIWKQGKQHAIPDALSRAPVDIPDEEDKMTADDCDRHVNMITSTAIQEISKEENNREDLAIRRIKEEARNDEIYIKLTKKIREGFPDHIKKVESILKPYWTIRHQMTIDKDLILVGSRVLIPSKCRKEVLQRLHTSHQAMERTKQRARRTVYWPCINSDITNMINACEKCQVVRPSQTNEPIIQLRWKRIFGVFGQIFWMALHIPVQER